MSGSRSKQFKHGEIIFLEGDSADYAYIIDEGQVEIFQSQDGVDTPLGRLGVGEIFGEMAVLDSSPRMASARTVSHCRLTLVSQEQMQERVEQADPVVRLLLLKIVQRSRDASKKMQQNTFLGQALEGGTASIPEQAGIIDKIKLESELVEALEEEKFRLFYQPIVDLKTQELAGFEALIRWQKDNGETIRPDLFMGIAEETSLIVPIGRWVLKQACKDFGHLRQALGLEDIFMGINVSGKQLGDQQFFPILEKGAGEHKVPHKNIKLEITEGVLLDGPIVDHWVENCQQKGFKVALDDFGTGYSSLSYLSRMTIDNLKVDQSFVRKMLDDPRSMVLTRSITSLAAGLQLPVIAEGIEEPAQAKALRLMGCTYGQGYLFGKPQPLDEVVARYTQKKAIEVA